jgi:hypothetical protein
MKAVFVIAGYNFGGYLTSTSEPFENYPNDIAIQSCLERDVRAKYVQVEKRYIRGEEECGSATSAKAPSAQSATERAE